jgi:tetratricopeptide (TPR) repeat protein
MELALTTPLRRGLFLAAVLLLAALLGYTSGRIWRAEFYAGRGDPNSWERAAALEPGNGDHWYRLGWYHQNDFASLDLEQAIEFYEQALARNSRAAAYWMDLAGAWEARGDAARAREAFDRAREAHPASGEVAWRFGNFLLRQEELPAGFLEIRRALELDPQLIRLGVALCWRAGGEPEQILDSALPHTVSARLLALEFFLSQREIGAALTTWDAARRLGERIELRRAVGLVDALVERNRLADARTVWEQAVVADGTNEDDGALPLVWDGDFSREPLNGGFGWRVHSPEGVRVDFDETFFRSPPRSLRLRFDGTANVDLRHVWQLVPVEPNRWYRFSGYLRTEGVSTDSGVRFWITDAQNRGALDVMTNNVVGTQPWALEEATFQTGPQTRLVRIEVRRPQSRKLDNRLRGAVWVDAVALEPALPGRRAQ